MITEETVVSYFDRANPVPDVEGLDVEEVGVARHLELLEARSREVTKVETEPAKEEQAKKSGRYWLVAAIAAVVLGAGILFLNGGGNDAASSEDIAVIESLIDDWNSQDGDAIAANFTSGGVFDATVPDPFLDPWVGRDEIAQKTAGYSTSHTWISAFDFTQMGDEVLFNLEHSDLNFVSADMPEGSDRPQAVAVVINDGLIESFVIVKDLIYLCIGETTSRCVDPVTGEVTQADS